MFLLLLQMLLISCLAETGMEKDFLKSRRRKALFLPHQDRAGTGLESHNSDLPVHDSMDYEEMMEQEGLFVLAPGLGGALPTTENNISGIKKTPQLNFPLIELHKEKEPENWGLPQQSFNPEGMRSLFPPQLLNKKKSEPPHKKNAKKFWNHFMFQKNSASQDLILPIKTIEVFEETCKTLPFSQSIVHENCEETEVQNNLCFGKCSSFHVPGPEDHSYSFCSHCRPTKFTMSRLKMNCTGPFPVVKMVMVVEECKCEVQKDRHPPFEPLHTNTETDLRGMD
ncbi:cerberus [Microcaecilia unicolor]|uniref:Cerberus n=1 Tax=Microcaecilia unicolor TaxID=1415580 RepID=A0A6P7X3H9_9AMPH|nr:cerberus [Microcaecilia unicolor]